MRHLPKHLRPRYRYLAVEIETWPDVTLAERPLQEAVWTATRTLLGDPGSAEVDPRVLETDLYPGGGWALVRVRRGTVEQARAAIACVDSVQDQPVRVGVRGVGGTVRATRRSFLQGPPAVTDSTAVTFRDGEATAHLREDRVDVECADTFVGATPRDL
ncbi:Rpp14/Pop5 family protein [Halodesulfurarchaeum formicicum]|uniref:Ribonuclease P protein component 2 n=1 Tax=Halodesulfurarchaeum formicicum TaxID=1873524 RepID=A0A1J1AAY4_9EURY|nr:Rpp14/Pop5 family protein [Halodesulfurarchaeum formicicum]APE95045.1 ribonuclease P protein subunit RPP14 [Halodesulfurarchaeum formicicum]